MPLLLQHIPLILGLKNKIPIKEINLFITMRKVILTGYLEGLHSNCEGKYLNSLLKVPLALLPLTHLLPEFESLTAPGPDGNPRTDTNFGDCMLTHASAG